MSPRQRMINLMYIVLTAMLALNVSSDVLNGFSQVHEGLTRTNNTMSTKNEIQFAYLKDLYDQNPAKAGQWYKKGEELRSMSADLYNTIDSLKLAIAKEADGVNGNFSNLINQDNLEAASVVMLNPNTNSGKMLREKIVRYRDYVTQLIPDSMRRATVMEMLSVNVKQKEGSPKMEWEEVNFDNMPAIAAITMLAKIQGDVRQAESEALTHLINNVDIGDLRVNELSAYVIPQSTMLMKGGKYSAQIVLAAIDTTQRPTIYIGGKKLSGNTYELIANSSGTFDYSGYIEVPRPDGTMEKHNFSSSYSVMADPVATISPTMMNVLYAGIDNPISISVPGITMNAVNATMTNGTLTRNGDSWIARPGKVGDEAVISVTATVDGKSMAVGSMTFRVRKLPDPTPYIAIKGEDGNTIQYKGIPKRISKAQLLNATGLGAAIDDDILNVNYTVLSFSMTFFDSMGNAIPENSDGAKFSARQIEKIKQLKAGKSFFISNVKATGPDGITRDISPMEVGLNN